MEAKIARELALQAERNKLEFILKEIENTAKKGFRYYSSSGSENTATELKELGYEVEYFENRLKIFW